MLLRNRFVWAVMICLFAGTVYGQGKDDLKKYFNDAAVRVKAVSNPDAKREILSTTFSTMSRALDAVRESPLVSERDRKALLRFESTIQDKQNELTGTGGYARIADEQLNAFADYTVQEAEQADQTITISVVTLLLIIILVVLLVR